MRVLIADDDVFSRALLHRVLFKLGYDVTAVADGEEAWELLRAPGGPRLAILDWMMPRADGPEICRRIRASRVPSYVYIILLTARTDPADLVAGLEAGADDYLTKPFQVNELKQRLSAGQRVMEFQERNRIIAETASDGIVTMNGSHRIQFANTAAGSIFGYPAPDLINRGFSAIVPDFAEQLQHAVPAIHDEKPFASVRYWPAFEICGKHSQGRDIELEISFSESRACDEAHLLVAVIRDITERKRMQRQLAQSQKLESIGQLAAGVAHEINTPIQYVGDNIRFLSDAYQSLQRLIDASQRLLASLPAGMADVPELNEIRATAEGIDVAYLTAEIPSAIEQSLHGIEQVARIVRAMKELAHPGPVEMAPTDLNHAIENAVLISQNEWKYVADVVTEFNPCLPPVPCVAPELSQVLINLIVNAAHAIAEGGRQGEKGTIEVSTDMDEDWAQIDIRDTGTGIPEAARSRVFDPFFTTKEVGKGTGQGLAIAYAVIVRKHAGTITFDTETGKGTTFRIRLPLQRQPTRST